jgi:predicted nucleic acid-binding protein
MVIEASTLPGWSGAKTTKRLRQQATVVRQLSLFQVAVDAVLRSSFQVLSVEGLLISTAATLSRQHGLLTNDALTLAAMQQHGLAHLASHDADFDRVPGVTRYGPA